MNATGWRHWPVAVLLVVSAGLMTLNVLDNPLANRPLGSDETWHLLASVHYGQCFSGAQDAPAIWTVDRHYPPLVTALAGVANSVFGESNRLAIMVIALFIPLLLVSVFGLARGFGLPPLSALTAALSLLFSRQLFSMSREFMLDFPLVAMVALSAWAIIAADDFKQRTPALLAGVCIGLAALTKWTAPLYLAPLMIIGGIRAWPARHCRFHWLGAIGLATLLAIPWYGPNLGPVIGVAMDHAFSRVGLPETGAQFPSLFSIRAWMAYLLMLIQLWQWLLFLLSALGVFAALFARGRPVRTLGVWIVASYILVSLLPPRDPRFIAPLMPALAVAAMIPCGFPIFSRSWHREISFAFALLVAVFLSGDIPGIRPLPIFEKFRQRWEYRFQQKWGDPPPPSHTDLSWLPDSPGLTLQLDPTDLRLRLVAEDCLCLFQDRDTENMIVAVLAKYPAFLDGMQAVFDQVGNAPKLRPVISPAFLQHGRLPGDVEAVLMLTLDESLHTSKYEWPSKRAIGPGWTELQRWPLSDFHSARLFIRILQ